MERFSYQREYSPLKLRLVKEQFYYETKILEAALSLLNKEVYHADASPSSVG